jgi:hypothetical protein
MLQDDLSVNHSYGRALFIEELQRHHPFYRSLSGYVLEDIYAHLRAFVHSRRNQTIMRGELEEKLMEKVAPNLRPPIQPVRIYTIASDDDPDIDDQKLYFEWASFFGGEGREYPPAEAWNERVLAALRATKHWIPKHRMVRRIALSGSRRLSAPLAIGFVFSAVSGFAVEMMYRGNMWATDAHPNSTTPTYLLTQSGSSEDSRGDRLVVSIGIVRDIAGEVESDLDRHGLTDMPVLHLQGEGPIVSPEQSNLVVGEIKAALSKALDRTGARQVDLFFAGPAFLALFLGHHLNATAPVQCYEHVGSGLFVPTCQLRPS